MKEKITVTFYYGDADFEKLIKELIKRLILCDTHTTTAHLMKDGRR